MDLSNENFLETEKLELLSKEPLEILAAATATAVPTAVPVAPAATQYNHSFVNYLNPYYRLYPRPQQQPSPQQTTNNFPRAEETNIQIPPDQS